MTIESDGKTAPYSVKTGIYGLMFYTYFISAEMGAEDFKDFAANKKTKYLFFTKRPGIRWTQHSMTIITNFFLTSLNKRTPANNSLLNSRVRRITWCSVF